MTNYKKFFKVFKIGVLKTIKKLCLLWLKGIALCSFFFASFNANTTCMFIYHQPKLPDEVKKLRKF